MLYFKALRDGLDAMPPADAAVRAALDERAAAEGWPALHAELARVDPATAARLAPATRSASSARWRSGSSAAGPVGLACAGPRMPQRGLAPADRWSRSRAWLHQRIAARFDAMLAPASSTRCARCARAATCTPAAVDALRGLPPGLGGAGRRRPAGPGRLRERAASPPRASWPSAS
jgi:hypothetical protein